MSDSSRHALYFVKETVYGTTPDTPTFKRFRNTGCSLGVTKSTNVSEESREDRQIDDLRHGNKQVGGDLSFELSYGSFDDTIEAVLCGTWAPAINIDGSTVISVDEDDDSYNGVGLPGNLKAGDKITVAGFTTSGNNGEKTVATVASGKITVTTALTDEAAGDAVDIVADRMILKAGVERRSFSLLRQFTDIASGSKPFHLFKGVEFNTFNLSVAAGAIVTGSFGVLGQDSGIDETAPSGSTLGTASTTMVFSSFSGSLKEGGSTLGIVTEVTLTLENGLEPRFRCFSDLTLQPSIQRSNLTGQLTVYFENSLMLEKFLDETDSSLDFTLIDKAGNAYRFYMPRIKYNGGQPDTTAQGPITLSMPFQALYDDTNASQIVIEATPV